MPTSCGAHSHHENFPGKTFFQVFPLVAADPPQTDPFLDPVPPRPRLVRVRARVAAEADRAVVDLQALGELLIRNSSWRTERVLLRGDSLVLRF